MTRLALIGLNELNFEYVRWYNQQGRLPTFHHLIETHGIIETESESAPHDIEPWIQWVSVHTGLSLAEHKVFRLGDIVETSAPQIWEQLEAKGVSVGAVSPMNAANRVANAAFFLPDPWTETAATGPPLARLMHNAIRQAVSSNAAGVVSPSAAVGLMLGAARFARLENYGAYTRHLFRSAHERWRRAIVLDMLLADTFLHLLGSTRPQFASLFLNAGAHLQHHYMFNSPAYAGDARNPNWYIAEQSDPLLAIYETYDNLLRQLMIEFPDTRFLIATGLHQVPHERTTFYWRLRSHDDFLTKAGIPFARVEPRMSRDFLLICNSNEEAMDAERRLACLRTQEGATLFTVDNRGTTLFVELTFDQDIPQETPWIAGNAIFPDFRREVAFVAIKNGEHDGIGYLVDTRSAQPSRIKLTHITNMILEAFHEPAKVPLV